MQEQNHHHEPENAPVLNPLPERPLPVPPIEIGPEEIPAPSYTEKTYAAEETPETETEPAGIKEVNRVSRVVFFILFSVLAAVFILLIGSLFT